MSTSIARIEEFFKEEGLKYTLSEDYLRTSFITDNYRDQDGERSLFLVIKLEEDGEYFKLIAPHLYHYPEGPYAEAVFRALLVVSWKTKLLQFEFDEVDGEIRGIVEFPLEDSQLTRRQLMRCVNGIVRIVDEYHPVLERAIESGIVDFERAERAAKIEREADDIYGYIGKNEINGPGVPERVLAFED
ncbi:MAG: hypothetical protein NT080_06905 [Spirochaetes bacterium]|nr:hypothetical protein [Spirochaetota bacterium]